MAVTESDTATIIDLVPRAEATVEAIPLELLVPAGDNPRRGVGDAKELEELAASLKSPLGQLQNLLVTPRGDGTFLVVAGHRRLAAAHQAGLPSLKCEIRDLDDDARAEAMLVENLQREDLDALEEADAYARLVALGYSQRKIAQRVNRSQSHISKRIGIAELPAQIREALDAEKITVGAAEDLAKLADIPQRFVLEAFDHIANGRWSPSQAVSRARQEATLDAKENELREQLASAGVEEVEWDGWSGSKYVRLGKGHGELDIATKAHAADACHAAYIDRYRGKIVFVCSKPASHKGVAGGSRAASMSAVERRQKAEDKARRDAKKVRSEAIRKILDGPLPAADVLSFVLTQFLDDANHAPAKTACELLGIDAQKNTGQYQSGYRYKEPLVAYSRQSAAHLSRAAVALALGLAEEQLGASYHTPWTSDRDLTHFAFLQAHGYQLTAFEQANVEPAAKKRSRR